MQSIETISVYKGVAVVAGPRVSFLDHIMPLVHRWNIPLVCTDPWVFACAQLFYPPAEMILAELGNFQKILSQFKTFVTVEPCRLHPQALQFGEFLYQGPGETIAALHGNPYKFRSDYWIERYAHEDCLLIYGQHLIDYLGEKGVFDRLKKKVFMGNIRKRYYEEHRAFFDRVAQPYLFPENGGRTIFWAPTWHYPHVPDELFPLKHIPDPFQILFKPHPFMFHLHPEKIAVWREEMRASKKILFLEEIPLIYPLIQKAQFYLGDYSSVAYDFLSLDRPLFLIGNATVDWAVTLTDPNGIFAASSQEDTLSEMRQKVYRYVYDAINRPAAV
jgi:hypothetical protein